METLLKVFAVPLAVLNMLAGVVGGTWLLFLGQWRLVLVGFAALGGASFVLTLAMLPGIALFEMPALKAQQRGERFRFRLLLGAAYADTVLAFWCVGVLVFFSNQAGTAVWPFLLVSYAVAIGPLGWLARKAEEAGDGVGALLHGFFTQLGLVAAIVVRAAGGHEMLVLALAIFGSVVFCGFVVRVRIARKFEAA